MSPEPNLEDEAMPSRRLDFDAVRAIALALPGVEDATSYGAPSLKARGQLLACVPVNRSAEPGSVAIRIDLEQRAAMLDEDPATYYVTEHYEDHPIVLVRLSRIRPEALRDLLGAAWRFVTAKSAPARTTRPVRRRTRRSRPRQRP